MNTIWIIFMYILAILIYVVPVYLIVKKTRDNPNLTKSQRRGWIIFCIFTCWVGYIAYISINGNNNKK